MVKISYYLIGMYLFDCYSSYSAYLDNNYNAVGPRYLLRPFFLVAKWWAGGRGSGWGGGGGGGGGGVVIVLAESVD